MVNSRQKGKRGELEAVGLLKSHGFSARRGVQYQGGTDSPDIVSSDLPNVHFEVKRVQAGNLYKWMEQAEHDAGEGKMPVVLHKRNGLIWMAIMSADDYLKLLRRLENAEARVEGCERMLPEQKDDYHA